MFWVFLGVLGVFGGFWGVFSGSFLGGCLVRYLRVFGAF